MRKIYAESWSMDKVRALLKKPAFDEVEVSAGVQKATEEMFGAPLTAQQVVDRIVGDVRREGDRKVLYYTNLIDKAGLTAESLMAGPAELERAYRAVEPEVLEAMRRAIANVRRFHEEQMPKTWLTYRPDGAMLGQQITPLDSVGLYVPGGTAAYPSSVIMNAVPAAVAGVKEIVMVAPPAQDGSLNPYVLVAANETGVSRVYKVGGAQAVAALAFGTETIPKVDKIVGPGNLFVTLAKKAVYGHCDIDMLAGPSEILILADDSANPRYLAADLLSQAEHDPLASAILITTSREIADAVEEEVDRQLSLLPRKGIASQALERQGLIVVAKDVDAAIEMANLSAPEHLEVAMREPFALLPKLRHAGAIFLGNYTPEPLGDYYAGPNHVLPTGGTARFYSVLNVETFMKKTSLISYTQTALNKVADDIIRLAEAEGLAAHAEAIRVRKEGKADGDA